MFYSEPEPEHFLGAGAGTAEMFYSEPEPEHFLGAGAGAGVDQKCHGSASLDGTILFI